MSRGAVIVGSAPGDWGAGTKLAPDVFDRGDLVVVYRHGIDRSTPAHLVDHHAHVRALADAGVDRVVALSSVGSLRVDWGVGTLCVPDDFYAPAVNATFFTSPEGHQVPGFNEAWRQQVLGALDDPGVEPRGTYAQTSGPRFETPAEVRALAHHADLVGMTVASECILAAELGIAYAALCSVDNLANGLDVGRLDFDDFTAAARVNAERLVDTMTPVLPLLVRS